MRALRLALRGLRWRRGQSLVLLAVATAAAACAALGPIWSRAAEESLLAERLHAAPLADTALLQTAGRFFDLTPADLVTTMTKASHDPGNDAWFAAPSIGARITTADVRVDGRQVAVAGVGWYDHGCAAVRIAAGRCPTGVDEAMVPVTAQRAGVALGKPVSLQLSDLGSPEVMRVVGFYDRPVTSSAAWAGSDPFDGGPSPVGALDRLDTVLVARASIERATNAEFRSYSIRPLRVDRVRLSNVAELDRFAARARLGEDRTGTGIGSQSKLPELLSSVADERSVLRTTTRAVTVQLVLLADFVLFLVVAASTEERAREVALAKLRGMRALPASAFGLAEPMLVLVSGLPLGLALAWLLDLLLARQSLRSGTSVVLTGETWLSLAVALLGAAAACVLAARRTLTASVVSQLNRTGGRRARLSRSVAVDAVVVTVALAGGYELSRGGSDELTLLAPGMLALAAALLAVRTMPWLAQGLVRRTRRSTHVSAFLAIRQVARRPAGLRIVVLLAVATALAVFTVDSYAVAARNRVERARVEIGADRVVHVAQTTPARLAAAVRAADPDGTRAMAALTSGSASNPTGPMVAVDAARLAAVGQWQRRWWSEPPAALLTRLRPKTAPSVVVHDAVVVHVSATGLSADAHLQLQLDLRDPQGARLLAQLGTLLDGPHDYRAALPSCRTGCRLATIHFANPTPNQSALGTVVVERITDSAGVVDAGLTTRDRWRPAPGSRRDFGVLPATRVTPGPGGLTVDISGRTTDDAAVDVADRPAEVPALVGPDVDVRRTGFPARTAPAIGLDGSSLLLHPLPVARVLPRVFRDGLIVDLDTVDRADVSAPLGADYQVWLSPSAGPDVVAALRAAGLVVQRVEVRSDRLAELDHDGVSLALRLFLVATLAAVVLAIAAVASSVYVGARRREFELAAVRTLGASRRVLVGAARTEQLALLGLGVVLGLVTSLTAARWALPAIPPLGTGTSGVPARFAPAWEEVAALTAGVVLLSIVTADLLARAVVRAASADRLREGAQ